MTANRTGLDGIKMMGDCLTALQHHWAGKPSAVARSSVTSDLYLNAAGSVQSFCGSCLARDGSHHVR